ncbi:acetylornithine deacetylase/succinyl-diaminopimelate desuccinylase-like protein [Deinococcus metalli]|uniref:Acetylornithine deacetylase/succinyl-diaminopimelate desuccinylase-like protein n=1 Tax=Deinococcus metalli TaxID=1141878 RepID=A0A7W8KCE8_9DEIO|nr:dipeptidase [Deinococcus metalli]MBB5375617.1 acetylornithine deacetylase/succinyl-diaminopimelate desuccinylase-like protein [Deinococcus metalli]GHF38347.1 peptidase M20 [Deinococcus metalli]
MTATSSPGAAPVPAGLEATLALLRERADASLAELIEFAGIPSVSAQSAHRPDMERAAAWLAARLECAGMKSVSLWPTAGHPAVYGEWLGALDAPTVLVYGHYDVQPPDPLERWHTPPFTPTVVGERVYGRGVSDDKGPLLLTVQAADALLSATGRLPLNVKFLFEGEEEVGSAHLPALVKGRAAELRADFVISADGGMWSADFPSLTVSGRGLTALEFTVHGPAHDLHSGRHGGSVHNPLHAAAALVAGLHDEHGRVTVPGFYDGVTELPPEQREALTTLPFTDAAYLQQTGAPAIYGEAGYTTLERQWHRPTVEVNGMWGGYTGEGSKTVLPAEAHVKLSCRLVPGQDPERVHRLLRDHLSAETPPGVRIEFVPGNHHARAYALPATHPARVAARRVLRDVYGTEALEVGMGGSIPILETFQSVLGLDSLLFSFAVGDENIHAPDEFFRIPRVSQGQEAWARLWWALGAGG